MDSRFPHLSRIEDRPTWLSFDEAVRARAFAKTVCDKVVSLRACWNNHARAIYFYYGGDCQNAAWTYELCAPGQARMYPPLESQDVDDVVHALWYGRMSAAEKDAIMSRNERLEEEKRVQGLGEMTEAVSKDIDRTVRESDRARRGIKKIINAG